MSKKVFHCMFEQSGTFKNEFKKLGYEAFDYDILNDFGETDYLIDLFKEIENAYDNKPSIFDNFIPEKDEILAFFPCIRFENQIILWFRGETFQQKKWTDSKKLKHDLKLHEELSRLYSLITKFVLICIDRNIPLIIENPAGEQHYLTRYWAIKSKVVDTDRTKMGDYQKKPTQYWFINREPSYNFIFEATDIKKKRTHNGLWWDKNHTIERSMISKDYANRFIREFILYKEEG